MDVILDEMTEEQRAVYDIFVQVWQRALTPKEAISKLMELTDESE